MEVFPLVRVVLIVELGIGYLPYCGSIIWSWNFWGCDKTTCRRGRTTWTGASMVWKSCHYGLVGRTLAEWRFCNLDVLVFLRSILSWMESLGGLCHGNPGPQNRLIGRIICNRRWDWMDFDRVIRSKFRSKKPMRLIKCTFPKRNCWRKFRCYFLLERIMCKS